MQVPTNILERIRAFAPEHAQRLFKVLDAVVYSDGKPNRCNSINLSRDVEIEDEPFPYVTSPMDEEAWIWADGIRAKPILQTALIDFDCCCDEHEDIINAIVDHPTTLQTLRFGKHARFANAFFYASFQRILNLRTLAVFQRVCAAPICDPDVMDVVFAGIMARSRDTLERLELTLDTCTQVCSVLPTLNRLQTLQINRFRFETTPDLRGLHELHTVSIRQTRRMHEIVQMLPASLKSLHIECNEASDMYDAMSAFITTHGQLESFRLYIHIFDEETFVEKMYPVLMRAKHIRTFKLYGPNRMRPLEVPGFEKECHISWIKFFRPEFC